MDSREQKTVKFVTGRQKQLEQDRTVFESEWQLIADYVIPIRENIDGTRVSGSRQGTKIFDGSPVGAAVLATDGIHGYHVSPAFTWFNYAMAREEFDDIPEIRQWLQAVEFGMYAALNRSNFYDEMWSNIYDGITIGTAPLYMEEDVGEGKLVFESVHPGEIYLADNKFGEVDVVYRKRKWSARKFVQKFGIDNVPTAVKNAYDKNPFQEFEFTHAVNPREDWDDRKKDAKSMRYASISLQGNHLCQESGYEVFPYSVWRYTKSGKEVYGRSPVSMALSDIMKLNIMGKTMLGRAQMEVDPPLMVPVEMKGKVQWKPRGQNVYTDPNMIVRPLGMGGNFTIGVDREKRTEDIIKEHLHVDFFLMLAQLEGRGNRTAYEVSKMQEEKAAVLGAELAPLNKHLDRILDWVFDTEMKAGRLPQPPEIMDGLQGERFDPVYMGPLAQAQRRLFSMQGIRTGLTELAPLLQIDPEVIDIINRDGTGRRILKSSGFPQTEINSKEKVDAVRQARMQAQKEESQKEDLLNMAKGAKDLGAADKAMGGNLQNMMAGAISGGGENEQA